MIKIINQDSQIIIQIEKSMNPKYKQHAIPLITVSEGTGSYNLTAEASEFLRSIPGPIGVVSVAGLYRTGKSYLLNQMLLNRSNGFGVGPTVLPCTKGLWCWGTPIKGQTAEGQKLNIIVIDTEGIGAPDEDQTHDARVFTLAILASSCFIYNSVGSIDETAVQNLSLIVNLTKHIQLRTEQSNEDLDPDRIANYFPSFFWVVRDFMLQIVDTEGNKLSSKEYLEKALAPHKGTSQGIEQKNKIRKLLTSYFKDRQCLTLVRPLINEEKLQDLDKMNFEDLRPQFVNQVINFRKRIVGRMKPKMLNGQKLNGELYYNMLSSYVKAINEGAVPNIENAWNYMCQEQCTKVMAESLQVFEKELKEIRVPCSNDEINKGIDAAQEVGEMTFKAKSIGEDADRYLKELHEQMRVRGRELRQVNADEGKIAFKKYITPFVASIQPKINKEQYGSIEQFLQQMNRIEQKIGKEGPNYVDSNLNCQIFIRKLINQGVPFLSKRMRNEKQQIKKTLQQRIKLNELQIQNLRKQREGEQVNNKQKLIEMDKEKIDLVFKLQKLSFELDRLSKQRSSEEQTMTRNLNTKKAEIQKIRKQFEAVTNETNFKVDDMLRNLHEQRSNWQKQKAIYQLKIKQQIQKIDELEKKKLGFDSKLVLETNQLSQKHREQATRLQQQIQELIKALSDSKQKHEQLIASHNDLNERYNCVTEKYEISERKLREQTNSKQRQLQRIRNQHELQLSKIRNESQVNEDQKLRELRQLQEKLKKHELKTKQLYEQLKNTKGKYQRQNQILSQQLQFAKHNCEDTKTKLNEIRVIYESKIAAMEEDNGLQREEQVKKKIAEMKSTHQDNLRNAEAEFKEIQNNLGFQITTLTKTRNELELKLKVTTQQLTNQRTESEQAKQGLICKVEQLQNEIRQLQRDKNTELIARQGIFAQKLSGLQRQLQQSRENYHSQKTELQSRVTNQITQIKNYYEMEREKQEARHSEQKDKLKKKCSKMVEDYQKKLQEESENYQEELQKIESEYGNEVRTLSMALNELTHEKDTLSRERTSLQDRFNSLNDKYTKMETELNERLQRLMDSSRNEKEVLSKKLEDLKQLKNEMEKELLSLTHQRDQFRSQTQKQGSQIDQLKVQNSGLIERFESIKRTLEEKLKQVQGSYMRDKSKFQTDLALLQQKKDFSEEKIGELEYEIRGMREHEQEQTRELKEKYHEEILAINTRSVAEKKAYEERMDKIKKQSAETENCLAKQLSEVSKAKAVDQQKIEYLEKKLIQNQSKRQSELEGITQQLRVLREKSSAEKLQLKSRVQQLQQSLHARQCQVTQVKNQYEIQLALAQSKIKSQLQWSESILAEKVDTIRSLEKQLDESRRRNENEKSSQQLTHQQILSRMQAKYRGQITQLSQQVTKRTQQLQYSGKQHERNIKDLTEKLAVERQARVGLESKVVRVEGELVQREAKMSAEIDKLRQEKEGQSFEMQKQLAKEKEGFKVKLAEFEKRTIETDRAKQQAVFEKEKQEARWKMQRNQLQEKLEELREGLDRQKNQSKKLVKDNQKLKAEKKKNNSFINGRNQTTYLPREVQNENKENTQQQ